MHFGVSYILVHRSYVFAIKIGGPLLKETSYQLKSLPNLLLTFLGPEMKHGVDTKRLSVGGGGWNQVCEFTRS